MENVLSSPPEIPIEDTEKKSPSKRRKDRFVRMGDTTLAPAPKATARYVAEISALVA
jgi:hypothetical protein